MSNFLALLNNTFAVERRMRVPDGQGGHAIVYVEIGTVRGRLRPALTNERMVADSEEQQITHVLYVVAGADVARGDLVSCGETTVEVLGVREPSLAGHHWEVDCLERQQESQTEMGS